MITVSYVTNGGKHTMYTYRDESRGLVLVQLEKLRKRHVECEVFYQKDGQGDKDKIGAVESIDGKWHHWLWAGSLEDCFVTRITKEEDTITEDPEHETIEQFCERTGFTHSVDFIREGVYTDLAWGLILFNDNQDVDTRQLVNIVIPSGKGWSDENRKVYAWLQDTLAQCADDDMLADDSDYESYCVANELEPNSDEAGQSWEKARAFFAECKTFFGNEFENFFYADQEGY